MPDGPQHCVIPISDSYIWCHSQFNYGTKLLQKWIRTDRQKATRLAAPYLSKAADAGVEPAIELCLTLRINFHYGGGAEHMNTGFSKSSKQKGKGKKKGRR